MQAAIPPLSAKTAAIEPFHVMELVKEASELERQGRDIVHMSIGEPDFTAIPAVVAALEQAARAGRSQYTPALGLTALREAIAGFQADVLDAPVNPEQVIVTTGASGALTLACAALLDPGSEVLMADPAYPCNRHIVTAAGGRARLLPTTPSQRFQLTASQVQQHWGADTAGVLVASPSNPTGTSMPRQELAALVDGVRQRGGFTLVDEIYLGLSYDGARRSAASLGNDLILVNSFSKYFHMTGWRLGWLVVPLELLPAFEKLAQNLVICAPALAQHAALACFTPEALGEFDDRRDQFRRRRDALLPEFERLGLAVPVTPDGAFYIYADVSRHTDDPMAFARAMLHEAGVCAVPGVDFGHAGAGRYMRFSYANSLDRLLEGMHRIERWLNI